MEDTLVGAELSGAVRKCPELELSWSEKMPERPISGMPHHIKYDQESPLKV